MRKALPVVFGSVAALLCSVPQEARAGGFSVARFGGEHGHPTTDNPTAIYYNPAGIAASSGINLFLDGSIAYRYARYERQAATGGPREVDEPPDGIGANNGKAGLFNVAGAPMIGATGQYDLTDSIGAALGVAFFVPFGGSATWSQNEAFRDHPNYPGAVDGTQRWWTTHGTIRTMYLSGAGGVSINDLLYVGISGGVAFSQIDTLRARTAAGDNAIDSREGRAWFDASGIQGHLGGGVMVEPIQDKLRIGLSYQAPPGFFDGVEMSGLLRRNLGGNITGEEVGPDDVQMNYVLPDVFRLGVSYAAASDLELRLFGDFQRWSLFTDQCLAANPNGELGKDELACAVTEDGAKAEDNDTNIVLNIPRRWNDTFGVRAGMSYWPTEDLEVFAGVGYDSNAVPDEFLDPALMDFHDVSTSLGGRYQFNDWMAGALSYTQLFYIPRSVEPGTSRPPEMDAVSSGPDANGTYKQSIGVLNVNLQANFDVLGSSDEVPIDGGEQAGARRIPGLQ